MRKARLFTIGYEGRETTEFISFLKALKITRLIDIREVPLSRKKGFSKSQLKKLLESNNIEYIHLKELGSPSSIRHQLKRNNDYNKFCLNYLRYLESNQKSIEKLYEYLFDKVSCLMCFERSAKYCHRSVVAEKVNEYNGNRLKIIHI
jgi:uncharacterized protein (DUF488 family)